MKASKRRRVERANARPTPTERLGWTWAMRRCERAKLYTILEYHGVFMLITVITNQGGVHVCTAISVRICGKSWLRRDHFWNDRGREPGLWRGDQPWAAPAPGNTEGSNKLTRLGTEEVVGIAGWALVFLLGGLGLGVVACIGTVAALTVVRD